MKREFFLFWMLNVCRLLVGLVFIFSGFVKGIDPLGSVYKFSDYFAAFGWSWLQPLALILSVVLSTAEFLIGVALVVSLRMRTTSWATLVFMTFFTILTLVIAITNPVTDCGCFGDALIISNWQTFYKNLVLLAMAVLVFTYRANFKPQRSAIQEWSFIGIVATLSIVLSLYCLLHLPIIDFRPYRVGTDIVKSMEIPEGMPLDEYTTYLYYEKDGSVQQFTLENYPWEDSTWTWVETRSVLVKKGFEPPIHNFSLTSREGVDITNEVLSDEDYVLLMISHSLDKATDKQLIRANTLAKELNSRGIRFLGVTASPSAIMDGMVLEQTPDIEYVTADEITLKTIVRSNPGFLLLHRGTVLGKWSHRDLPEIKEGLDNLISWSLLYQRGRLDRINILLIACLFIVMVSAFFSWTRKR
jgi:uncharacterized membrane protein YphA (DoxX/SURF4 family)